MICSVFVGYNVVVAKNNGKVQPCYFIKKDMGSIYKKIRFNKNLMKCPFDSCACPFSIYEEELFKKALLEIKETKKNPDK